ncbi:MAG: hypothetical protein FJ254_09980 [Phycisphaerae bacterium]|nr:hypothetical protein [Phycisphaerae bacterium]
MNTRVLCAVTAASVVGMGVAPALAKPGFTYYDSTNDIHSNVSTGGGTLDLVSMEVSNTATDLIFRLTVNGSLNDTNWGKFMVGIATNNGNGTSSGNGWNRPINMSANGGMTHWVGSWVDSGGGAELRSHAGGWGLSRATYNGNFGGYSFGGNQITWTVSLDSLGLSVGQTFAFDAYSSGGGSGDGAIDALSSSSPSVSNWGDSFTTTSGYSYTVVPAPGALALLGLAGLGRRSRR